MNKPWCSLFCLAAIAFVGCGDSGGETPYEPGPVPDGGKDQTTEANPPSETGTESAPDGPPDVTPDVAPDSGSDASDEVIADADAAASDAADQLSPEAGTWTVATVDNSPKFKARVAMAIGIDNEPQLAYDIATANDGYSTPGVTYAVRKNGTWDKKIAAAASGVSNEYPDIVVDSANRPIIVYNRNIAAESQIDIHMVTGDGAGGFHAPVNLTKTTTKDEYAPTIAIDGNDLVHVIYQERAPKAGDAGDFDYSIGYVQVISGQPQTPESVATGTSQFALNPDYAIAVGANGILHALYCKPGSGGLNNVLYYRRRVSNGWDTEMALTEANLDVWSPAIGVDGNDVIHIAYVKGADWDHKTVYYKKIENGSPTGDLALTTSTVDRTYYLGLAAEASGTVHIGFSRFFESDSGNMGDIFHIHFTDVLDPTEERITDTPGLDESTPVMRVSKNGHSFIAFTENLSAFPDGVVYLASD